jgi:hypothetical protein
MKGETRMSDVERMLNELRAYDDYRLNLLAQAILQLNEGLNHVLDPTLEMRLYDNFQYNFGEDYEEVENNE